MLNKIKKISRDVRAFTLTEVMIGMMILTVAIVSASNLLMGIIDSNRNNLTTLQAYYLSQEGLEMVRNIRDTNWLHNRDWLGASSNIWGGTFALPTANNGENKYAVSLRNEGMNVPALPNKAAVSPEAVIAGAKPWSIVRLNENGSGAKIYRHVSTGVAYMDSSGNSAEDTGFKRTIIFKKYDCGKMKENSLLKLCAEGKFALVQSKVEWYIGAKHRELILSEVLTNWKGGAL